MAAMFKTSRLEAAASADSSFQHTPTIFDIHPIRPHYYHVTSSNPREHLQVLSLCKSSLEDTAISSTV